MKPNFTFLKLGVVFIFILSTLSPLFAQIGGGGTTTTEEWPCDSIRLDDGDVNQSSIFGNKSASNARDSDKFSTWSQTLVEENPYWEIDFGGIRSIKGVQITWPTSPDSNYYILFYKNLPETNTLSSVLSLEGIRSIHIAYPFGNNEIYKLDSVQARYVRIQKVGTGALTIGDVGIFGRKEICGNGKDDDCDGLIDCNDVFDCGNFLKIGASTKKDPTCNVCNDGEIFIYGGSYGCNDCTSYSINGGLTWFHKNEFIDLPVGDYPIMLKNENSGCILNNNDTIKLRAKEGFPTANCENGDFELGNFKNWILYIGRDGFEFAEGTDNTRHRIISSINPELTNGVLSLDNECQGSYALRLGNPSVALFVKQKERIEYQIVKSAIYNYVSFKYAAYLNSTESAPDKHAYDELPYFEYSVFNKKNPNISYANNRIRAKPNENDLISGKWFSTDVLYTLWRCKEVDLTSAPIGDTIVFQFTTSDCTLNSGLHFGMAFIDGLCAKNEPIANFNIKNTYCLGDSIIIDGSDSKCENAFKWEICELNNNQSQMCLTDSSKNGLANKLDIKNLFSKKGLHIKPDVIYKVKLTVSDNCGNFDTLTKFFTVIDTPNIHYFDFLLCRDFYQNVVIPGSGNPIGYTYQWSPANIFVNPTVAYPKLLPNLQDGEYNLSVNISKNGCVTSKKVRLIIYSMDHRKLTYRHSCASNCKFLIELTYTFNFPITGQGLKLRWENLDNNEIFLSDMYNQSANYIYTQVYKDKNRTGKYKVKLLLDNGFDGFNCDSLDTFTINRDSLYFGNIPPPYVPNIFNPSSVNPNNKELIAFEKKPSYNAFWYKFELFTRWGERAFSKTGSVDDCAPPFPDKTIRWNGLQLCDSECAKHGKTGPYMFCEGINGCTAEYISFPDYLFTYTLQLANCDIPISNPIIYSGDSKLVQPTGQGCYNSCCSCRD